KTHSGPTQPIYIELFSSNRGVSGVEREGAREPIAKIAGIAKIVNFEGLSPGSAVHESLTQKAYTRDSPQLRGQYRGFSICQFLAILAIMAIPLAPIA